LELGQLVRDTVEKKPSSPHLLYPLEMSLKDKMDAIARLMYGADGVVYTPDADKKIAQIERLGFGSLPVCSAKTQYSLSDDPSLLGRPTGFKITVSDAKVSAGAGFVVMYTGSIMTMPGLPKAPAAENIGFDEQGNIVGLF
jgi:formate--tetrahydrofolate ligase